MNRLSAAVLAAIALATGTAPAQPPEEVPPPGSVVVAVDEQPAGRARPPEEVMTPPTPVLEQPAAYALPPVEPLFPREEVGPDPLLDRPFAPQPGPFANVDLGILNVHLRNQLQGTVSVGDRSDTLQLFGAPTGTTVSPRFELGYRLADGWGELSLAYRFLTTSGSATRVNEFGTAAQHGGLELNVFDFDYGSREYSLGPFPGDRWYFKWTIGVRLTEDFFDNNYNYALAPGAAADAIIAQRSANSFVGVGPHAALDVRRNLCGVPGLAVGGRLEGSDSFGKNSQKFFEELAGTPATGPVFGRTADRFLVGVLSLRGQVGLSYEVPEWNHTAFFLGYQYESWFQFGRLDPSRGQLDLQGFFLRGEINF